MLSRCYLGLRQPGGRQCVNAGLLLYGPQQLLAWFRLWRAIGRTHNFPGWGLGDQSVLSVLCVNLQFHRLLPDRWNQTHANSHWRPDLPSRMSRSIYHFCGRQDRAARIAAVEWRATGRPPLAAPAVSGTGRFVTGGCSSRGTMTMLLSTDQVADDKCEVVINGTPHLISQGEAADKDYSRRRLIEIANGLLEDAGSEQRLFAVSNGRVVLLTEEMQDYVESIGDVLDYRSIPREVGH